MELLLAVMLLGVLVSVVYSTFFGAVNAGERAVEVSLRYARALRVLDEMGRELENAFLQSFYRGEVKEPLTIFKGEDDRIYGYDADKITFWTLGSNFTLSPEGDTNASEMAEISYYWEADYENETIELWKRIDYTPDRNHERGGFKMRVIPMLRSINYRYFDGKEWKDEWEENELPRAIEIVLTGWNEKTGGEERGYYTLRKIVIIRMAEKKVTAEEKVRE